ncbi:MAG: hypothetical protein ACJ79O_09620 [Myxococcales bacterium]
MQVLVPAQAPVQAVRFESDPGLAVRVMAVPLGKLAEHVVPQSMPAGLDVTDPFPVTVTFNV